MDRSTFKGNGCAVDVTAAMKDSVQDLMNKTAEPALHGSGRNSQGVTFDEFVVTKVERIQNMAAWSQYNMKRELGEPHSSVLMDRLTPASTGTRTGQ